MNTLSYASLESDLRVGFVYKWTNLVNGKMYIGSHNGSNAKYLASGIAINNAFLKYGLENFKRELMYVGPCYAEVEDEILKMIDASRSPNFYNLINAYCTWPKESFKSGINHPSYGKKHTKETRMKISEIQIGRKASEETRKKMSESRQGENNSFYGKTHTEETKAKISAAGMGRVDSEETREKRRQSLTGRTTSPESKMRSSFTKHIQNHIEKTPKRKYTCRWCNGDTLDQAIKDVMKEEND